MIKVFVVNAGRRRIRKKRRSKMVEIKVGEIKRGEELIRGIGEVLEAITESGNNEVEVEGGRRYKFEIITSVDLVRLEIKLNDRTIFFYIAELDLNNEWGEEILMDEDGINTFINDLPKVVEEIKKRKII